MLCACVLDTKKKKKKDKKLLLDAWTGISEGKDDVGWVGVLLYTAYMSMWPL